MLHTRIRSAGTLLLVALALAPSARTQDKKAPPRPVERDRQAELRAQIVGRTPDEARAALDHVAQEWLAHKGTVEVAYKKFSAQWEVAKKDRARLAALKEPDAAAVPPVARAADVDAAIKVAQQLADYHAARLPLVEAVVASATTAVRLGSDIDAATAGLFDCHARVTFALGLATNVPADKLPAAFAPKELTAVLDRAKVIGPEVRERRERAQDDLNGFTSALATTKAAITAANAKLEELKAGREAALAAFSFEEQVQKMGADPLGDEFARLRKLHAEKSAAIKGNTDEHAKAAGASADARAKLAALKWPTPPAEAKPFAPNPVEEAARSLFAAQQYLGARVRAAAEREDKTKALLDALDEQEKRAVALTTTLDDVRRTAAQLATAAAEIGRRVGRGDLDPAKAPDGLTAAWVDSHGRAREELEQISFAAQQALAKVRAEREALRAPDPDAEAVKSLTAAVLAHVSARLDLHTDLKRLAAEYARPRAERAEAEQKRLDRRAADRATKEAAKWDVFLALDRSKPATDAEAQIDAYYKELVELEEKEENVKRQREALDALADRATKEAADVTKLRAVLAKHVAAVEPVREWDSWLWLRLAPGGLKAEAAAYHDELARLATAGGANARRVQALTGAAPTEPNTAGPGQAAQPATGGEIAKVRTELLEARARGLIITGIKIALVLLAALILPRLAARAVRRGIRGGADAAGNPSPVLGPLRRVLRLAAWAAALAVVLSILGFDVTALVIALAIVALAGALAARSVIADALGAMAVFADRRFKTGDVIRLGGGEPARVVGITWRSTALKNANGLVVSVPNRAVTETTVENLSRGTDTYDALAVTISTDKDAGKVIAVIRAAMAQCKNLSPDNGVTVVSYNQKGGLKVVQYRFWWFLKDYEARNKTRDEVFARIAMGLAQEDMSGIEVALA